MPIIFTLAVILLKIGYKESIYHGYQLTIIFFSGFSHIGDAETVKKIVALCRAAICILTIHYVHTGNDILDIILKEKSELAREKSIAFSVTADLNGVDFQQARKL